MVHTSINDLRKSAAEVDKWIKSLERWVDASLSTWRNEMVESCYERLVDAFKVYRDSPRSRRPRGKLLRH